VSRLLASLSVLALALATLAFGAVYAPFTSEESDSGTITAASNVSITVLGTSTSTLDFELVSDPGTDCDAIFPGDACTDLVLVTNVGDVNVTLSAPTATETGDLEDCEGGDQLSTTFDLDYAPGVTVIAAGGGVATFNIFTTFSAGAGDDCQGDTGTVEVTVVGTATS
jgi:hypothetical protein